MEDPAAAMPNLDKGDSRQVERGVGIEDDVLESFPFASFSSKVISTRKVNTTPDLWWALGDQATSPLSDVIWENSQVILYFFAFLMHDTW